MNRTILAWVHWMVASALVLGSPFKCCQPLDKRTIMALHHLARYHALGERALPHLEEVDAALRSTKALQEAISRVEDPAHTVALPRTQYPDTVTVRVAMALSAARERLEASNLRALISVWTISFKRAVAKSPSSKARYVLWQCRFSYLTPSSNEYACF